MRVLMIGDIVGEPGRKAVERLLPQLKETYEPDLVIANGENMARGIGITPELARDLLKFGVDGITLGNHALRHREIIPYLNESPTIVRPANMQDAAPGRGTMIIECAAGRLGVANMMGSLFLEVAHSPFDASDRVLSELDGQCDAIVVDFHAEATSEKVAFGHHVDGLVGAVVGTHTHVQTSDARVLAGGTAFITDMGMTGPHDSVIGVKKDIILRRFRTGIGARFEPANTGIQIEGVIIDLGSDGKARSIEAYRVPLEAS